MLIPYRGEDRVHALWSVLLLCCFLRDWSLIRPTGRREGGYKTGGWGGGACEVLPLRKGGGGEAGNVLASENPTFSYTTNAFSPCSKNCPSTREGDIRHANKPPLYIGKQGNCMYKYP